MLIVNSVLSYLLLELLCWCITKTIDHSRNFSPADSQHFTHVDCDSVFILSPLKLFPPFTTFRIVQNLNIAIEMKETAK